MKFLANDEPKGLMLDTTSLLQEIPFPLEFLPTADDDNDDDDDDAGIAVETAAKDEESFLSMSSENPMAPVDARENPGAEDDVLPISPRGMNVAVLMGLLRRDMLF